MLLQQWENHRTHSSNNGKITTRPKQEGINIQQIFSAHKLVQLLPLHLHPSHVPSPPECNHAKKKNLLIKQIKEHEPIQGLKSVDQRT